MQRQKFSKDIKEISFIYIQHGNGGIHIKAIIPIAGNGTRLLPQTLVTKKALLPIYDGKVLKPAILILVEEISKEVDEILLVIRRKEKKYYKELLKGYNIKYVNQRKPKGLGHALKICRKYIKDDYFSLFLGDMIYKSNTNISCTKQLFSNFNNKPIMSIRKIPEQEIEQNGMVYGKLTKNIMKIEHFFEKPTIKFAKENNIEYGVFGSYIIPTNLLDKIDLNKYEKGEIQFSTYLESLCDNFYGILIDGKSFDIGVPWKYYETSCKYMQS